MTGTLSLFDAPRPAPDEEGKRSGMTQAGTNADPEWKDAAYAAVQSVARRLPEFTTDDVWQVLDADGVARPHEPAAMGCIMRKAALAGVCEKTRDWRKSTQRTNHARDVQVWRSLIR